MCKLIGLELRRNRLGPYHGAAAICGVCMLAFQYLMAAVPYLDPADQDAELFRSYSFVTGMTGLVSMAVFTILGSVMASRFILEEYNGKHAILLFSYPVSRRRILAAKLCLVTGYTVCAVLLCGGAVYGIFFLTEALAPICSDRLTLEVVLRSSGFLTVCAILAGFLGLLALWIGFRKRSTPTAIVAAVILASVVCQVVSVVLVFWPAGGLVMGAAAQLSVLSLKDLFDRVEKMEV